jgi:hypothetical protein
MCDVAEGTEHVPDAVAGTAPDFAVQEEHCVHYADLAIETSLRVVLVIFRLQQPLSETLQPFRYSFIYLRSRLRTRKRLNAVINSAHSGLKPDLQRGSGGEVTREDN